MTAQERILIGSLPEEIYLLPNKIPWNKLLLDGKLAMTSKDNYRAVGVKTRNYPWPSQSAQPFSDFVLLYNSSRTEGGIAHRHHVEEKQPEKALVGLGFLVAVKYLSEGEESEWMLRANNAKVTRKSMRHVYDTGYLPDGSHVTALPGNYGLFFSALWKFEKPIDFDWPAGPVQSLRIKTEDIRGQLQKASIVTCGI